MRIEVRAARRTQTWHTKGNVVARCARPGMLKACHAAQWHSGPYEVASVQVRVYTPASESADGVKSDVRYYPSASDFARRLEDAMTRGETCANSLLALILDSCFVGGAARG